MTARRATRVRVYQSRTLRDEQGTGYDVIICIAGLGFKVRQKDIRRLPMAISGKVLPLMTIHLFIEHTRIRE